MELNEILAYRKRLNDLRQARSTSANPLDIIKAQNMKINILDLETTALRELRPGQAGYRATFDKVLGRPSGVGTSLIDKANIIEFALYGQGRPGGPGGLIENIFVEGSYLPGSTLRQKARLLKPRGTQWAGHSRAMMRAVLGKDPRLPGGAERLPFQEARTRIQGAINRLAQPGNLVLGHNIVGADLIWLQQMGIDTSGLRVVDTLRLASILNPKGGTTAGQTLESLARDLLGEKEVAHMAGADVGQTWRLVMEKMFSSERWAGYSQAQKNAVWDAISPQMAASRGMSQSGISGTASILHNVDDPFLLRDLKWTERTALFRTTDGGRAIRKIIHTGTERGRQRIVARIKDKVAREEFEKLFRFLDQASGGRIHFGLERRGGLEHFFMFGAERGTGGILQPTGVAQSLPWLQTRTLGSSSAATYRGRLKGVQGGYIAHGPSPVRTNYLGLWFNAMRTRLFDPTGGIEVGMRGGNLTSRLFRAFISNTERSMTFIPYEGEELSGVMTRSVTGRTVRRGALLTGMRNLTMGGEIDYAVLGALENQRQFITGGIEIGGVTSQAIDPIIAMQNEFADLSLGHAERVRAGKKIHNRFRGIKAAAKNLLEFFSNYRLTDVGVKSEDVMKGIFVEGEGLHMGLSKKAREKGTYAVRGINIITDPQALDRLAKAGFREPALIPHALQRARSVAERIGRLRGARIKPMVGIAANVAFLRNPNLLATRQTFGDPGVYYTQRGARFVSRKASPRILSVRDLSDEVLAALTPEQFEEFKIAKGLSSARAGSLGTSRVLGTSISGKTIRRKRSERILGINFNSGTQAYDITLSKSGLEFRTEIPLLISDRRATAFSYLKSGQGINADFIAGAEGFNLRQMYVYHLMETAREAGLSKEMATHLASKGLDPLTSNPTDVIRASRQLLKSAGVKFKPQTVIDKNPSSIFAGRGSVIFKGVPVFQRYASEADIGFEVGGALKLRLEQLTDMAAMEGALGIKGAPMSSLLGKISGKLTRGSVDEFKFGIGVNTGFIKQADVLAQARQAGLETYTLADIRAGGLQPFSKFGMHSVDALQGTYYGKHLNRGFVLDLGQNIGALPLGMRGNDLRVGSGLRYMYIPSARMAGFGTTGDIARISSAAPYSAFQEAITLAARGQVSTEAIAQQLFIAQSKFLRSAFGKDKSIDRMLNRTRGIRFSSGMRIIPQRSLANQPMGHIARRRVLQVDVDLSYLRKHRRELGLSKEYIESVKQGRAYGYVSIAPPQRAAHSMLVKVRARDTRFINKLMRALNFKNKKRLAFPELSGAYSQGLGVSEVLQYFLERDVDKDAIRMLWLDHGKQGAIQKLLGESVDVAGLGQMYQAQQEQLVPGMIRDYRRFIAHEMRLGKALDKTVKRSVDSRADELATFLGMKGTAAAPWVKFRGDRAIIYEMWNAAERSKGDRQAAYTRLVRLVQSQFGFRVGINNPAFYAATRIMAENLPSAKQAVVSRDVIQRYMQFMLEKAGKSRTMTETVTDALSMIQTDVYRRLQEGKFGKDPTKAAEQAMEFARGRAELITRAYLEKTVKKGRGKLKLEMFARNVDEASSIFGRTYGYLQGLRGVSAYAQDPIEGERLLAKSVAAQKLFNRRLTGVNALTDAVAPGLSRELSSGRDMITAASAYLGAIPGDLDNVMGISEMGLPIAGNTELIAELQKYGYSPREAQSAVRSGTAAAKVAQAVANQTAGAERSMKSALAETIGGFTKDISSLWKTSPVFRYGVMGAGALAAIAQIRNQTEDQYLAAPSIETSAAMQMPAPMPRAPMVRRDNVQYPIGPNPVQYQQRVRLGRTTPAVQMGGNYRTDNANSFAAYTMDNLQNAGIQNGIISINDARTQDDITQAFSARDAIASDY